jgi:hypothetical protein
MSSSSEDEEGSSPPQNGWQNVSSSKRRKVHSSTARTDTIQLHNKFSVLSTPTEDPPAVRPSATPRDPKPPPIFVYGVTNYSEMIGSFRNIVSDEQYIAKCRADNTVKINCQNSTTYRALIKYMRNSNIIHHTYQPKEERAYRIVLKYVHHSVNTDDIAAELEAKGHRIRQIINGRHWKTKEPLNIFFIDLEPADNNTDVFKIQRLLNQSVNIETPRRYSGIVQCTRCQQYGHSKTYCNKPYVCVKCGGKHNTVDCKKPRDAPATCALCNGPHTANYKGCDFYHHLLRVKGNDNNRLNLHSTDQMSPPLAPSPPAPSLSTRRSTHSYADIVQGKQATNSAEHSHQNNILSTFLAEFKNMFHQLQQNSMVINMLTMLLSKK